VSVLPPRPLLAACLVLLGALAWAVEGRPPPTVSPGEAWRWEGQAVVVEGWALGVSKGGDGGVRMTLSDGGSGLATRLGDVPAMPLANGDRLSVAGRIMRGPAGDLTLLVDDPSSLRRVAGPDAEPADLATVALDPGRWSGRLLRLSGTVERGHLQAGGRTARLGDGPWPSEGPVQADGFVRYDPGCLCHAVDAVQVRPWTP
jgi:hypothetical protein